MATPPLVVLIPGLGGDAQMFHAQRLTFPTAQIVTWLAPQPAERLPSYAKRLAAQIQPAASYSLVGASFGGLVALELACLLPTKGVVLLGSLRSLTALPLWLRCLRRAPWLANCLPVGSMQRSVGVSAWSLGSWSRPWLRGTLRQVSRADTRLLRWGLHELLRWQPPLLASEFVVRQIHGGRDWVFPLGKGQADHVLPDAGHLLTLTHGEQVNRLLQDYLTDTIQEYHKVQ